MINLIGSLLGMSAAKDTLLKHSCSYSVKDKYSTNQCSKSKVFSNKARLNRKVLKCNKK